MKFSARYQLSTTFFWRANREFGAEEIDGALLSARALAVPWGGLWSGEMWLGIRKARAMEGWFQLCTESFPRATSSAEVPAVVTSGVHLSISHW